MTVGTQVQQAINSLKSAQASFESFALETENQSAKQTYQNIAQQCQTLIDQANPRFQEIQQEEPQYKQ